VIVGCSIAIMPHLTKEKQAPQEKWGASARSSKIAQPEPLIPSNYRQFDGHQHWGSPGFTSAIWPSRRVFPTTRRPTGKPPKLRPCRKRVLCFSLARRHF